ncbi:hypothetical protein DEO72_LG4g1081 [Vigna unguiculata]|nr:hypothetical protein DEO72_LG4g1081 [Vigna unguiculata]
MSWSPERPLARKDLGEPLLISPRNPNFPYLERGYTRLRHGTTEHSSSREGLGNWRNSSRTKLLLNPKRRKFGKELIGSKGMRSGITYTEQKTKLSLEQTCPRRGSNPNRALLA